VARNLKIVLGTSVGVDRQGRFLVHYPSRWTSTVDRNPIRFYPFELAYASTLLKARSPCHVKLIDAGARALGLEEYADLLIGEGPDILVIESATRCFVEDATVAARVRDAVGCHTAFVGQHATACPNEVQETADSVIVGEYEFTLLHLVQAMASGRGTQGLPGVYPTPWSGQLPDVSRLPWPEDDDISRLDYAGPLPGHRYRQIQIYGSRGCPMRCNFCVAVHVYYQKPNWRPRDPDDIVAEMQYLVDRYGGRFDGVFFDEEAHFLNKGFVLDLCRKIIEGGLDFLKISAMGTYFSLDDEMLQAMRAAGYCHLKIGIETASAEIAAAIGLGRKHDPAKLRRVLASARELGVETYGNFQVGALGSTFKRDMETAELVHELLESDLLCEMQVSICTPQPGTPFYAECKKKGYLVPGNWDHYDGSLEAVVSYPQYSRERIEEAFRIVLDIGHHLRGLRDLRQHGLFPAGRRALERVGIRGIYRHLVAYYLNPQERRARVRPTSG
jgi:radical SAM superfamily enzyme YgiQ (UPF0313 family)